MSQNLLSDRKFTLTQRALLTLVGNMLVQLAEFLTGFFVTPYIIRGLGQELYGAWGMIQQIIGYFSLTDFRAPTALRFLLGLKQHEEDIESKQKLIGNALILWALTLPLAVLIGAGLVWFAPLIIHFSPENAAPVRIGLIVLLANSVIDRVLAIPMHILRAQNLDYVGMGLNTFTVFGGSLLSALAIWLGYGLPGLAIATMLNIMLISIGRFIIARRALPWIKVKIPRWNEFLFFFRTSAWLLLSGMGSLLVYTTDTILVGYFLGPSTAAIYVTTGLVMRLVGEPMYQVISAGNAGLMGLCGQQDWERVAGIRKEMYFLLIFFMTILGTGIIALNGPFLALWIGSNYYGGPLLTTGIVASMTVMFLSRIDLLITDAMLLLREKTWALLAVGIVMVLSAILLLNKLGAVGMAFASLIGNTVLLIFAWVLIGNRMGIQGTSIFKSLIRPLAVMLSLFGLSAIFQAYFHPNSWVSFLVQAVCVGVVALIIGLFGVLPREIRLLLFNRAKHNIPLFKNE